MASRSQRAEVAEFLTSRYDVSEPLRMRIAKDTGVHIHVDGMPNAKDESGWMFAGWLSDILRDKERA